MTKNLNWEISTKYLVNFKRWDGVKMMKNFNNIGIQQLSLAYLINLGICLNLSFKITYS